MPAALQRGCSGTTPAPPQALSSGGAGQMPRDGAVSGLGMVPERLCRRSCQCEAARQLHFLLLSPLLFLGEPCSSTANRSGERSRTWGR